jgi:hypothetical protein
MKRLLSIVALSTFSLVVAGAQTPRDVPAGHWARASVTEVIKQGVMPAPNGAFSGDKKVSRTEMAIILANFARALEAGKWPKANARAIKDPKKADLSDKPVSRYELAAVLDRVGRIAAHGLPSGETKRYGKSNAIPPIADLKGVPASDPAYESLQYLAKNRMLLKGSVLAKPGPQPVTGEQVAESVSNVIAGVNDRLTTEPDEPPLISAPPHKKDEK